MKHYNNYAEQVADNLENLEIFNELNEIDEFYYEELFDVVQLTTTPEQVLDSAGLPLDTPTDTEEYYELENEYVWESLGSVYQLFKVDLKGGEYTPEHERLNVFYNDTVESYILPVFHFGTAWSYISAMGQ